MPDDEGEALFAAARMAAGEGPEPLIEIGAYCGKSTLYIAGGVAAAALQLRREPSVIFSLDHHRGSEENQAGWEHHDPTLVDPASGLMDTLPAWRRTLQRAGAEKLVVGLVGDSAVIAACWRTQLRFVFIDGGHGSGPAWADYRGWAPKLVPTGLLAIHDVFPNPADGGRPPYELYRRAIESQAFEECTDASCNSLKVLRRVGPGC
jgi:MMP 1-O-methyltransferase